MRVDGTVACWGSSGSVSTPIEGEFVSVSVGDDNTCGVKFDGGVVCWGEDGESVIPAR